MAQEIDDITADGDLAPEFRPERTAIPQASP
jgi:hypothetical protein